MAAELRKAAIAAAFAGTISGMALSPAMAAGDGFAAFWPTFQAAVAKDDRAALASMVVLGPGLDQAEPLTFAKAHSDLFGPAARKCLAKAKAVRDVDGKGAVTYSAFCGEVIYGFSRAGGAWKLTDIGAND